MRNLRRHANGFAQRWMRMDRLADVHSVCTHFNGQGNLTNHVARMGADHAAAQNLAVAVGFWGVVEQEFGDTFVAAVGDGAAGGVPGEQALLDLDALGLGLGFGEADPGHFGIGVSHAGVEHPSPTDALQALRKKSPKLFVKRIYRQVKCKSQCKN